MSAWTCTRQSPPSRTPAPMRKPDLVDAPYCRRRECTRLASDKLVIGRTGPSAIEETELTWALTTGRGCSIVEHRAPAERRRNGAFVRKRGVEIRGRSQPRFN